MRRFVQQVSVLSVLWSLSVDGNYKDFVKGEGEGRNSSEGSEGVPPTDIDAPPSTTVALPLQGEGVHTPDTKSASKLRDLPLGRYSSFKVYICALV